ncbi:hypothetical protein, partial [Lactococcus petauri]|uniref:hypothetical protein n=1 Tax=Lactococcus petauri TaxID=1940789 RepID=UPI00254A48F9
ESLFLKGTEKWPLKQANNQGKATKKEKKCKIKEKIQEIKELSMTKNETLQKRGSKNGSELY